MSGPALLGDGGPACEPPVHPPCVLLAARRAVPRLGSPTGIPPHPGLPARQVCRPAQVVAGYGGPDGLPGDAPPLPRVLIVADAAE